MPQSPQTTPDEPSRPCPICRGQERRVLYRQKFAGLPGGLLGGYDVVVCRACGLGFADRIPTAEVFERYYAEMSKYEYADTAGRQSPYDQTRFTDAARFIAQVMPDRGSRIIDIGCATGGQLDALKELGYHRLLGMDPSPACAAAARRLYGIEVVTGCLSGIDRIPGPFDLAILSGVLEHLPAPSETLARLAGRVAEGGMLFVQVPDVTGFSRTLDAPFQQFSTEHVSFFSPRSLRNLLAVSGFEAFDTRQRIAAQSLLSGMPLIEVVARKTVTPPPLEADGETAPALEWYVADSQALERRIAGQIDALVAAGRPILVWGAGTHTRHLLATSRLGQLSIAAFVDSNPHYHGKSLAGREIIPPASVAGHDEPILISSCVLQEEIAQQIRQGLGLTNELIRLYDRPTALRNGGK